MFPWNILLISLIASYKCEQEKDYISYYAKSSKSKENITLGRGTVARIITSIYIKWRLITRSADFSKEYKSWTLVL
jgi:hypothetical protein